MKESRIVGGLFVRHDWRHQVKSHESFPVLVFDLGRQYQFFTRLPTMIINDPNGNGSFDSNVLERTSNTDWDIPDFSFTELQF